MLREHFCFDAVDEEQPLFPKFPTAVVSIIEHHALKMSFSGSICATLSTIESPKVF